MREARPPSISHSGIFRGEGDDRAFVSGGEDSPARRIAGPKLVYLTFNVKHYGDDAAAEHMCETCKLSQKYETLRKLFRVLARNEFGLWDDKCCPQLGVRKGFLLVKPANYHNSGRMVLSGTPEEILQKLKDCFVKDRFCQN